MTPDPSNPTNAVWIIHTKVLHLADGSILIVKPRIDDRPCEARPCVR